MIRRLCLALWVVCAMGMHVPASIEPGDVVRAAETGSFAESAASAGRRAGIANAAPTDRTSGASDVAQSDRPLDTADATPLDTGADGWHHHESTVPASHLVTAVLPAGHSQTGIGMVAADTPGHHLVIRRPADPSFDIFSRPHDPPHLHAFSLLV